MWTNILINLVDFEICGDIGIYFRYIQFILPIHCTLRALNIHYIRSLYTHQHIFLILHLHSTPILNFTKHTYWSRVQPSILFFSQIHRPVKIVEELVPQQLVIHEVPLPSGILIALIVTDTRKVQPFRMSKFIT